VAANGTQGRLKNKIVPFPVFVYHSYLPRPSTGPPLRFEQRIVVDADTAEDAGAEIAKAAVKLAG
jgi:hypothetical protein